MDSPNFSFFDWEQHTNPKIYEVPELNREDLPKPPDNYQRGHLTMGKDPHRGLAIQGARDRKRLAANREFFLSSVLPLIETRLNSAAWKDLANTVQRPDFYKRGGFVRYVLGDRSGWIHPTEEPEKVENAISMGATPEGTP